jgi:hypothetical protein
MTKAESPSIIRWQCPTGEAWVNGKLCPDYGEKEFGRSDLSLRHFLDHALGEFFHFDSKVFRKLPAAHQ